MLVPVRNWSERATRYHCARYDRYVHSVHTYGRNNERRKICTDVQIHARNVNSYLPDGEANLIMKGLLPV